MTADETSRLLRAFQAKKALAGAGVIVIEGASTQSLKGPNALPPKIYVVLYQLDPAKGKWSEIDVRQHLALQLPKVGVQIGALTFSCFVTSGYAGFVGAGVAPKGIVSTVASTVSAPAGVDQANAALKEVSQELDPNRQLQMAMQRENQVFSSVSNVLKARHDIVKNNIGNIR